MRTMFKSGRPRNKSCCTWCVESKQSLKYVLPTQNGKKEFCSETCLAEFRKAYSKVSYFSIIIQIIILPLLFIMTGIPCINFI